MEWSVFPVPATEAVQKALISWNGRMRSLQLAANNKQKEHDMFMDAVEGSILLGAPAAPASSSSDPGYRPIPSQPAKPPPDHLMPETVKLKRWLQQEASTDLDSHVEPSSSWPPSPTGRRWTHIHHMALASSSSRPLDTQVETGSSMPRHRGYGVKTDRNPSPPAARSKILAKPPQRPAVKARPGKRPAAKRSVGEALPLPFIVYPFPSVPGSMPSDPDACSG